jgi:subtilisin family serine protease
MYKNVLALALALAVAACSDAPTAVDSGGQAALPAPLSARPDVAGRFIVTLRERINPAGVAREHGVRPDYVYTHALTGFAGRISDAARQGLLRDSRVARVEPDGIATIVTTQSGATWGLDRIDQRDRRLNGTYIYNSSGAGVTAYILDTGIRFTHVDFGGRATSGFDAVDGGSADDCNGHGTHVSGTVGGATYGVAKEVSLVAVRVLDCGGSGSWSGVIAGMDWVTDHHSGPSVANMSLGGGANASVDDALRGMIASGVATAVAAGNGNQGGRAQDACKYSPARVGEAMTIGATDQSDSKTSWSNYGICVDWFAPGLNITSAWYTNNTATRTISGTSMATPHTTGVAALYLQNNPGASPATVSAALAEATTKHAVANSKTTNDNLLFSNY